MKLEFRYVLRRVLVALILAAIFGLIRKAQSADVTMSGNYYGTYGYRFSSGTTPYFPVTVKNPGSTAITIRSSSSWGATYLSAPRHAYASLETYPAANVTIPAGGSLECLVYMEVGSGSGYHAPGVQWPFSIPSARWTNHNTGVVTTFAFAAPVTFEASFASGVARFTNPAQFRFPDIYISTPPPLGTIQVQADSAVTGAAVTVDGVSVFSGNIASGLSTVWSTTTPGTIANGAVVLVKRGTQTLGTGTVSKDQFGNFALTVGVTVPVTSGRIRFAMQDEWEGTASLYVPLLSGGVEVISGLPHSKTVPIDWSTGTGGVTPASVEINRLATLADETTGALLGSVLVVKDENGTFDLQALSYKPGGDKDQTRKDNKAQFNLDITSYRHGADNVLRLEAQSVTGVWFQLGQSTIKGHRGGARKEITIEYDNQQRTLNDSPYRWRSGTVTLAAGRTPVVLQPTLEFPEPFAGFVLYNRATIQPNAEDMLDEVQYPPQKEPEIPPPGTDDNNGDGVPDKDEPASDNTRKENFEDMASAVAQGLREGEVPSEYSKNPIGEGMEKMGSMGSGLAGMSKEFGKLLDAMGSVTPGAVPTIGTSMTYEIAMAGRVMVLDWSPLMTWVAPIRLLLEGILAFFISLRALEILRSMFI